MGILWHMVLWKSLGKLSTYWQYRHIGQASHGHMGKLVAKQQLSSILVVINSFLAVLKLALSKISLTTYEYVNSFQIFTVERDVMAQLISREHLFKLVKANGKVIESDDNVLDYRDFCKYHAECIKDGKRLDFRGELDDGEDKFSFAYDKVKETYLESKCPLIQYAGRGSSRAAFALAGGKCLKIAINARGVGQNKQELKNNNGSYSCFTQIYDNADDGSSLLTECCSKAIESDFQRFLGIPSTKAIVELIYLISGELGIDGALKRLSSNKGNIEAMRYRQQMMKLLNDVKARRTAQACVFADLLKFYENDAWELDRLIPADLEQVVNWGLVARDGQLCLVILDYGYSDDVCRTLY